MTGTLILVSGPSGSGKGTLIANLKKTHPSLTYPVSATTRAPRPGEVAGQNYYFLSSAEFDQKIADGAFLEWAEFGGNRYGTLVSEILPALEAGMTVVREVEIQGVESFLLNLPRKNVSLIFIGVTDWEVLKARIIQRAPISEVELSLRKERFIEEMHFMKNADVVVSNDGPIDDTIKAFETAIDAIAGTVTK